MKTRVLRANMSLQRNQSIARRQGIERVQPVRQLAAAHTTGVGSALRRKIPARALQRRREDVALRRGIDDRVERDLLWS